MTSSVAVLIVCQPQLSYSKTKTKTLIKQVKDLTTFHTI